MKSDTTSLWIQLSIKFITTHLTHYGVSTKCEKGS